jgi:glycosyltransferase involved in cell wall biosynthesis
MKNLQVSDNDLIGNRFNGHDLHLLLNKRGIESKQLVRTKRSNDPSTFEIAENVLDRASVNWLTNRIERELLVHSLLYPFSFQLLFDKHFLEADVVHYHLIQNYFFNIGSFPILSRLKPSVWTLHDPWAITGHCIHPFDCDRWQTGCGECPRLDSEFAIKQDSSALNWELKKIYYHSSNIDIVVASKWMLNKAQQSPLLSKFRLHLIPFGIDLETFRPLDSEEAKVQLGIPADRFVILFRGTNWELKGIKVIKALLHRLCSEQPICLLNVGSFDDNREDMSEFGSKFQIVDVGWVMDVERLVRAYNAADIVLMPSLAEGFGMMAVEAMGCGIPVIAMEGTALPETLFVPLGGICVPQGDVEELLRATQRLVKFPEERHRIGQNARQLAVKHYDVNDYVDKIIALYREVVERQRGESAKYDYLIRQLKEISLERVRLLPDCTVGERGMLKRSCEVQGGTGALALIRSRVPQWTVRSVKRNLLLRNLYSKIVVRADRFIMKTYQRCSKKS